MTQSRLVYILIPVHNRKEITLACLDTLQRNGDLERFSVVVIDDGSTDGTNEAISASYPEVTILPGDGSLWWTGAIAKGMEYAYQLGAEYFIWLNDDTVPNPDTLLRLVNTSQRTTNSIVTAQCYATPGLKEPTYGGRRVQGRSLLFLSASPTDLLDCDVCSGNLVCLPRAAVDIVGYPPGQQVPQTWGDVVYTWWAKQAGFRVQVLGAATAICPTNPLEEGWASSSIGMVQQWKQLRTPKSSIYPPAYWFYCHQVYGWMGVLPFVLVYIRLVVFTVLRMIMPRSWITSLKTLKDRRLCRSFKRN